VRYFTDGAVIGSRGWVNQVFEDQRQRFGPKRKDGARRFRFLSDSDIFGLRDLRIDPVRLEIVGSSHNLSNARIQR
jgi:putative transposase